MSTLTMTEVMRKKLDEFFANKTIQDVDRNTYLCCNLEDHRFKITISLIFMRDWHSIESDSYNSVVVENKGVVFTFPCYWCSVPKELCIAYFEYVINDFYSTEVSGWSCAEGYVDPSTNTGTDSGSSSNGGNGCNCNPAPPRPGMPPCQNNQFI